MPDDLHVKIPFDRPLRTPEEAADHLNRYIQTHGAESLTPLEREAAYAAYDERRLRLTEREMLRLTLTMLHAAWRSQRERAS